MSVCLFGYMDTWMHVYIYINITIYLQDVVDILGWDIKRLNAHADWRKTYEPVFILQRPQVVATRFQNEL